MARKRHPASTARGFYCFCLAPSIHKQIRSIRLIRGKIEIQRTSPSHQAKDIVVAPGEPFCTANGSYFALWLSVCQGQPRRVGRFSQASLLAWMNITTWLQGRKPRESNKLFDLIFPKSESVLSVVEQKLPEERSVYSCLSPCDGCKTVEG